MVRRQQAPAYDDGFVEELRAGAHRDCRRGSSASTKVMSCSRTVSRIQPDAVIAATGYRRGLDELVGHLGVLDSNGVPLVGVGARSIPRQRVSSSLVTESTSAVTATHAHRARAIGQNGTTPARRLRRSCGVNQRVLPVDDVRPSARHVRVTTDKLANEPAVE